MRNVTVILLTGSALFGADALPTVTYQKDVNLPAEGLVERTLITLPPQCKFVTLAGSSPTYSDSFAIPPNAANWENPPMIMNFLEDAELVWMMPHMHLRGMDMTDEVKYPTGESKIELKVPNYNLNWQLAYHVAEPIKLPRGTTLMGTAHYDNSSNNKFNPNPNQTVYYGDMRWGEMMAPLFGVLGDKSIDDKKVFKYVRDTTTDGA